MTTQYVPTEIVLYCRDIDLEGAMHAYPVAIDAKTRHNSAKDWAAHMRWDRNN